MFESASAATPPPSVSQFVLDSAHKPQKRGSDLAPRTRRRKSEATASSKEEAQRTLYVGNLPLSCAVVPSQKRHFHKWISSHLSEGLKSSIKSIRFRLPHVYDKDGKLVAHADLRLLQHSSKIREASIQDPRSSISAYVVFASAPDIPAVLSCLPREYGGRHLRLDVAGPSSNASSTAPKTLPSHKKCLFLGNLPLDVQEEELWTLLQSALPGHCIGLVRVLRDRRSSMGKGIGYVAFEQRASVRAALDRFSATRPLVLRGRSIRIEKCKPPGGSNDKQ